MAENNCVFPEEYVHPQRKPRKTKGHWSTGLKAYVDSSQHSNPEIGDFIYWKNSELVVVYDAFPKSKIHLLIIPLNASIKSVSSLEPDDKQHMELLQRMMSVADAISTHFADLNIQLWQGFHANPSLSPIHLHLISLDFSMKAMKKIIHWNSFTTSFFIPPSSVLLSLRSGKKVLLDREHYKKIKKQNPVCCRCGSIFKDLSKMQRHWVYCNKTLMPRETTLAFSY